MPEVATKKIMRCGPGTTRYEIMQLVLRHAAEPDGFGIHQRGEWGRTVTNAAAGQLVQEGKIFRTDINGKCTRYFTSRQAAAELLLAVNRKPAPSAKHTIQEGALCASSPYGKSPNDLLRVKIRFDPDAKEVCTESTKYTLCPAMPERYRAAAVPFACGLQRGRIMRQDGDLQQ